MQVELGFCIFFLSITTMVSPLPIKIKKNYLQLENEKYDCLFNNFNWILHRKKRYSPFYKRNYFHFDVPLSDKISTTTTPLPTTKLKDPGNVLSYLRFLSIWSQPSSDT